MTRFNALRHGVLSRYTVLPWEDAEEYHRLLAALMEEHAPTGTAEEHLVEELAGIVWRKRRLRLAEAPAGRRALETATTPAAGFVSVMPTPDPAAAGVPEGLHATGEGEDPELAGLEADEAVTRRALDRLAAGGRKAYGEALAELDEDTAGAWREWLSGDDGDLPAANAEARRRFLEDEALPWYARRRRELAKRALVVERGFSAAAEGAGLERLGRYEVHLDRKLERTLAMLLRLKQLRGAPDAG